MALVYLLDENQRGVLWRTIRRHNARGILPLNVLRVGDTADLPLSADDPTILLWCESEGRTLVTFDKNTMPGHLALHLQAGHHSPGIFMIHRTSRLTEVLDFLVLAAYASNPSDWQDWIKYIP